MDEQDIAEDLSIQDEVAARFSPFTCGPRGGSRASKKARMDESTTPPTLQDTSSDGTGTADSGTSSPSESESSVGASNCDSVLEDLEQWYTKLQPLGKDLHYEDLPEDLDDQKRYFDQSWDFSFTSKIKHQLADISPGKYPQAIGTPPPSILYWETLYSVWHCTLQRRWPAYFKKRYRMPP